MSTALALVNRMRAKRRDATSSIITDKTGVAYLDFLNAAITTVLEERTWRFQQRSDGILKTIAKTTGTLGFFTNGDTYVSVQGTSTTQVSGSFKLRIVGTDDANYGNTNFGVASAINAGPPPPNNLLMYLDTAWPGTSTGAGTVDLFSYEYQLPSTVRSVTGVVHQENPIALMFEDEQYTFDRLVPTPHDNISDQPQFVMVGGEVQSTATSLLATGTYATAIKVYPVPNSVLVLNYSYIYRQPILTVATDELNRVPPVVEDLIVDLATARVITSLEKDIQTGLPFEARVMTNIDRIHRNNVADAGRRSTMKSFDHIAGGGMRYWTPRTVDGLEGS